MSKQMDVDEAMGIAEWLGDQYTPLQIATLYGRYALAAFRLAENCRQPEADALRLLAYTGMRRGELLGLMEGNGRVDGDCIILGTETKTGRPRVIPVAPPAIPILTRLPLVLSETTLKQQFDRARKKAEMPHVRIHDLRHTYASWLAQANVSLGTIGALLGHSQTQTTRRYAHLSVDALREATDRLTTKSRHKVRHKRFHVKPKYLN